MTYFDINFVTAQHNRDVLANTLKVAMPVRHVLIRDTGGHIEHDNATLSLNIISIAQATELLLSCRVPYIKADGTEVGGELKRVNLHTESG